jgi:hypothetical protein
MEKINWHAMRWKIEMFQKILKSGRRAEASKLRMAEWLANLMAVLCILGRRVLRLTMLSRTEREASPSIAFTDNEIGLLDRLVGDVSGRWAKPGVLGPCLIKLARLGGHLAPVGDAPPGNVVA